jgi:hypothetical protein
MPHVGLVLVLAQSVLLRPIYARRQVHIGSYKEAASAELFQVGSKKNAARTLRTRRLRTTAGKCCVCVSDPGEPSSSTCHVNVPRRGFGVGGSSLRCAEVCDQYGRLSSGKTLGNCSAVGIMHCREAPFAENDHIEMSSDIQADVKR